MASGIREANYGYFSNSSSHAVLKMQTFSADRSRHHDHLATLVDPRCESSAANCVSSREATKGGGGGGACKTARNDMVHFRCYVGTPNPYASARGNGKVLGMSLM